MKIDNKYLYTILVIIIVTISFLLIQIMSEVNVFKPKISNVKNEIENLTIENDKLQRQVEYLKSDNYIDYRARKDLDLKKPNEKVIIITNELEYKDFEESIIEQATKKSNRSKWVDFILNR